MRKIEISHQGFELTKDIKRYVGKKVSKFGRYVKPTQRRSLHVEVKLKEEAGQKKNKYTAEMIVHVPNETLTAKESTLSMFAAIDIVEAKITNQLRKYKSTQNDKNKADRKRTFARFQRRADRDLRGRQN